MTGWEGIAACSDRAASPGWCDEQTLAGLAAACSGGPPDPGRLWWACEEPERPTDAWVRWHYNRPGGCAGCLLKARALAAQAGPDDMVVWLIGRLEEAAGGTR